MGAQGIPIGFHCDNLYDTPSKVGVISGTGTRGDGTSVAPGTRPGNVYKPTLFSLSLRHILWLDSRHCSRATSWPSAPTESLQTISANSRPSLQQTCLP